MVGRFADEMRHAVVIVTLTESELLLAANVASQRIVQNILLGRKATYGSEGRGFGADRHFLGCIGELALAKATRKYWSGSLGNIKAKDVGTLQVRATHWATGQLILHPDDPDDDRFFLARVRSDKNIVEIPGWIYARDGKLPEYLTNRDPNGNATSAAFFVPTEKLTAF